MYREFRNTFIFGEPGTGKSKFLRYYIEEVVDDKTDDSEIIMLSHKPLGYHSPRILVQATNGFEETIQDVYARYNARLQDENVKSLPKLYEGVDKLKVMCYNLENAMNGRSSDSPCFSRERCLGWKHRKQQS